MNSLVKDWLDYCNGSVNFDKSHFSELLLQDLDEPTLKDIFQYFPEREAIIERFYKVKKASTHNNSLYFLPRESCSSDKLVELVRKDIDDKYQLCKELEDNELCEILDNANFVLTRDGEAFEELARSNTPSEWVFELIADHVNEAKGYDDKILALEEACYGLAANYYLAWYIMSPLIDISIDFENYFNVWRYGGLFVITENEVLITSMERKGQEADCITK